MWKSGALGQNTRKFHCIVFMKFFIIHLEYVSALQVVFEFLSVVQVH